MSIYIHLSLVHNLQVTQVNIGALTTKWARNHQLGKHRSSKAENQSHAHKCFPIACAAADKANTSRRRGQICNKWRRAEAAERKTREERDLFGGEQSISADYSLGAGGDK